MTAARAPWGWAVAGAWRGVACHRRLRASAVADAAPGEPTGGQVQLTQARGTIWTGSAQLV